jgi:hypothetical protein
MRTASPVASSSVGKLVVAGEEQDERRLLNIVGASLLARPRSAQSTRTPARTLRLVQL